MIDPPSQYRPTSADLLQTVADFLSTVSSKLDSGDRYTCLVCIHILGILARESPTPVSAMSDEVSLVAAIRNGEHDNEWDAIFDVILQRTIARAMIVKPEHLALEHRRSWNPSFVPPDHGAES